MRARVSIVCSTLLLAACSGGSSPPGAPGGHAGASTPGNGAPNTPASSSTDDDGGSPGMEAGAICTAARECEERVTITGAMHATGAIDYPDPPPAGGTHNPCWGEWGVHDKPLPAENWVHNLEHGGVVLLYDCPDGCKTEVSALSDFVAGHPRTVLTAYDRMHARFAAVAWGYRLLMQELDLDAVARFYIAHFDHGPESIDAPPPSGCGP